MAPVPLATLNPPPPVEGVLGEVIAAVPMLPVISGQNPNSALLAVLVPS
nr:hypothetical protein RPNZKVPU_RPNZKVPU_CDS_0008 [Microvirus sp.]